MTNRCSLFLAILFFAYTKPSHAGTPADTTENVELIAKHFDRLSHLFDASRIEVRQSVIIGEVHQPIAQVITSTDGTRWKQSITHLGEMFPTPQLAQSFDDRFNITLIDTKNHFQYWPKIREVRIKSLPALPPSNLNLDEHITKTFLVSAAIRPHTENPLYIYSPTKPLAFRCRWSDLMLPDALRRGEWSFIPSDNSHPPSWLHMQRTIEPGLRDDLWLDSSQDYAICRREIQPGEGVIAVQFEEIMPVAPGLSLPMRCRWVGFDGLLMEQRVVDLKLGLPPEEEFQLKFDAGAKMIDERTGVTTFMPGGEEMLPEVIDLIKHNYKLPSPDAGVARSNSWLMVPALSSVFLGAFFLHIHHRKKARR